VDLTNGLQYRFYSDLEEPNQMDDKPFLVKKVLAEQVSEPHEDVVKLLAGKVYSGRLTSTWDACVTCGRDQTATFTLRSRLATARRRRSTVGCR